MAQNHHLANAQHSLHALAFHVQTCQANSKRINEAMTGLVVSAAICLSYELSGGQYDPFSGIA